MEPDDVTGTRIEEKTSAGSGSSDAVAGAKKKTLYSIKTTFAAFCLLKPQKTNNR